MPHDANNEPSPQPEEFSFVPMAERITGAVAPAGSIPLAERLTEGAMLPIPPGLQFCFFDLTPGCYRITYTPTLSFFNYHGTMRVDTVGSGTTISGDLYQFFSFPFPWPPFPPLPIFPFDIPVYPRNQYYSYLKVTNIQRSPIITTGPCNLTLTAEEYVYTQPSAGSFNGSFPTTPSRTVTIVLSPQPPPLGFTGSYFAGTVYENGIAQGSFTMGWVSSYFRKATLEVHTLTGAATPTAVPATVGTGSEDFRSVFATAGWDLSVIYDLTPVPVPSAVTPNVCWTSGSLFGLLASVITPATNLDQDWRFHLLVVPGTLGCYRGLMFDVSGDPATGLAPRQGAMSYSDDGYPSSESSNFGTAANDLQRHVPRAFLRSASHEIGHGFNQEHQEFTWLGESGADNSIMTTTPSIANFLASSGTGTFPDAIVLRFNNHVRHHLIHFPDPALRPGGMTFEVGHATGGPIPQSDRGRLFFSLDKLELKLTPGTERVKLGEPLSLKWQLVNNSQEAIPAPTDIRTEAQHTHIRVIDPHGTSRRMPSFVIQTDAVSIADLKPGAQLEAGTTIFWSAKGFAFEIPGQHRIEVRILWNHGGVPYGVKSHLDVWVDYPVSEADNEIASTLLHRDVGLFVALGGEAPYLKEAVSRIERAVSRYPEHPACKCLVEYGGHKYSRVKEVAS